MAEHSQGLTVKLLLSNCRVMSPKDTHSGGKLPAGTCQHQHILKARAGGLKLELEETPIPACNARGDRRTREQGSPEMLLLLSERLCSTSDDWLAQAAGKVPRRALPDRFKDTRLLKLASSNQAALRVPEGQPKGSTSV